MVLSTHSELKGCLRNLEDHPLLSVILCTMRKDPRFEDMADSLAATQRALARHALRPSFDPQCVIHQLMTDIHEPILSFPGSAAASARGEQQTEEREICLRELRERVRGGDRFPVPTEPTHDWRDGQQLKDM